MSSEHHGPLPNAGIPSDTFEASWTAPHVGGVTAPHAFVPASSLRERMSPRAPVPPLQTQSLGSAPPGLPALPGGFPTSAARGPRVEELLLEQNRVLPSLLQAQQAAAQPQQPSSSAPAPKPYVDPKSILEEVDPQIRSVFQEFEVESKNLFSAWATQKAM